MLPTNYNQNGCDPTSSECVIWQGPDIDCLELCTGDSISTVVHKLAVEVCGLIDILSVNSFDIDCFNVADCPPDNFIDLLNLIVTKICDLENASPSTTSSEGCPDCETTIAECFYYLSPEGDTLTSMQLAEYVRSIGNKLCTVEAYQQLNTSGLEALDARVADLENAAPPTLTLPEMTPEVDPEGGSVPLDEAVEKIDGVVADQRAASGDVQDMFGVIQSAAPGLNSSSKLAGTGLMSDLDGWKSAPENQAESLQNLWRVVNDMRSSMIQMKANCCNMDCDAINLLISGTMVDPSTLRLEFSGTIPGNFTDGGIGSSIHIQDAVGVTQTVNGIAVKSLYFDPQTPLDITLSGPNGATDLTITGTYRFEDPVTGVSCEGCITLVVLGTDTCPNVVLVAGYNEIDYSFTWNGTLPKLITVELWNAAMDAKLQEEHLNVTTSSPSDQFGELTEGTEYNIRLIIDGGECPFESVTTLEYPCTAPTLSPPTIDYTNPEGDVNGKTVAAWQVEYDSYHP